MIKYILFFSFWFVSFSAQQEVSGTITTENGTPLEGVLVININSEQSTNTDVYGNFRINAKRNDEIRFVKTKYDRFSYLISDDNLNLPIKILLKKTEIPLPEVEIVYHVTGDFKKDVKALTKRMKYEGLKNDLNQYMRTPLKEARPSLVTPSSFTSPQVNAVQIDVKKAITFISKIIPKKSKPDSSLDPIFQRNFLDKVKKHFTEDYFVQRGIKKEEIDDFLSFVNERKHLASLYSSNFNTDAIQLEIENALELYLKKEKL